MIRASSLFRLSVGTALRDVRGRRLPLLLAYLLLLTGSPVSRFGLLGLHLATEHDIELTATEADSDVDAISPADHSGRRGAGNHTQHQPHQRSHPHGDAHGADVPLASPALAHGHPHAHDERETEEALETRAEHSALLEPHAHDGVIHTHDPGTDDNPLLLLAHSLSELYVLPPATSFLSYVSRSADRLQPVTAGSQVSFQVDTPPPRLFS